MLARRPPPAGVPGRTGFRADSRFLIACSGCCGAHPQRECRGGRSREHRGKWRLASVRRVHAARALRAGAWLLRRGCAQVRRGRRFRHRTGAYAAVRQIARRPAFRDPRAQRRRRARARRRHRTARGRPVGIARSVRAGGVAVSNRRAVARAPRSAASDDRAIRCLVRLARRMDRFAAGADRRRRPDERSARCRSRSCRRASWRRLVRAWRHRWQ